MLIALGCYAWQLNCLIFDLDIVPVNYTACISLYFILTIHIFLKRKENSSLQESHLWKRYEWRHPSA